MSVLQLAALLALGVAGVLAAMILTIGLYLTIAALAAGGVVALITAAEFFAWWLGTRLFAKGRSRPSSTARRG